MKRLWRSGKLDGPLIAAAAFVVYLRTLAPGVGTEDPGELAAVLHTLGVAHPTGYPLFTMLGALFSRLPLGEAGIWRMNLFGAVLTATSIALFHGVFRFVLSARGRAVFAAPMRALAPAPDTSGERGGAAAATAAFAFSALVWFEAVSLEVYALHLVFLALVTRLFLEAMADRESPAAARAWMLFAYVLGLSFAHHMMTVLLAPAFLWLYFRLHGFGRGAWTKVLLAVPPFLLALSAYLYLPIRSSGKPLMNWGEPVTPGALWHHVTAGQYGRMMFSSLDLAGRKLLQFGIDVSRDFGYLPLLAAFAGLWLLWRQARRLAVFSLLLFGAGLFYAVNYAFDDQNFNLNAEFAVAIWIAAALAALWSRWRGWPGRLACAVLALCPLALNFSLLDKSTDSLVDDYARNMLESTDSGAVLFSNEYERVGGPSFYLQEVAGFRADVAVLDASLLTNPWFFGYLERRHPGVLAGAAPVVSAYRAELALYLRGEISMEQHDARLGEMFHAIVDAGLAGGRPVYVTSGINPALLERYRRAPSGLAYRLFLPEDSTVPRPRTFSFRPLPSPRANALSWGIRGEYAEGYAYQGAYRLTVGDTAGGIDLIRRAVALQPDFEDAVALLGYLEGLRAGR
jgi:hypothetical protein